MSSYYTVQLCWYVTVFSSIRATSPATVKLCRSLNWVCQLWAKSHADAICLFLIYTVRKIVSAKVYLKFISNQNLVCPACHLTSVQAFSCFKQINDTPYICDFTHSVVRPKNSVWKHFMQFFARTKFRSWACLKINPLYFVMVWPIFRERHVQIRIVWLKQLTARKKWLIAIALFLLNAKIPIVYQW